MTRRRTAVGTGGAAEARTGDEGPLITLAIHCNCDLGIATGLQLGNHELREEGTDLLDLVESAHEGHGLVGADQGHAACLGVDAEVAVDLAALVGRDRRRVVRVQLVIACARGGGVPRIVSKMRLRGAGQRDGQRTPRTVGLLRRPQHVREGVRLDRNARVGDDRDDLDDRVEVVACRGESPERSLRRVEVGGDLSAQLSQARSIATCGRAPRTCSS